MNLEIRSLIKVTTLPSLLLLIAFYFIPYFTQPLPEVVRLSLPYIPFILFIISIILSVVFHHCREFNLQILFIVIYVALDKTSWHPITNIDSQFAYLLLVSLIPFNYFVHFLLPERGILNQYGIRRLIFIVLQLGLIIFLISQPNLVIKDILNSSYLNPAIFNQTKISQPLLLFIAITGIIFFIHLIKTTEVLSAGIFSSFVALVTAVQFVQYPQVTTVFIVLAQLLIIISITISAYSMAYLDELTNIPSRRALTQSISTLGKRYTIAMVDIDHFKKFNDKYGHDIGDQVLKKLANQLQQVRSGKAFRYGGEEFTILFPNKDIDEARLYCEDLCKAVASKPFMLRHKKRPKNKQDTVTTNSDKATPLTTTISIGLAEHSEAFPEASNVIKQADKALYKAKKNGRNQVAV